MKDSMIAVCTAVVVATVAMATVAGAAVADREAAPLVERVPAVDCDVLSGVNDTTEIAFPERYANYQSTPQGDGVATYGVASGAFVGNYTRSGIQALTFKLATEGVTRKDVSVVLYTTYRQRFYTPKLNVSLEDNVFLRTTIGFDKDADGWLGGTAAEWSQALENVEAIGISACQRGLQAQSYIISNFALVGENGILIEGTLTPLEDRLRKAIGAVSLAAYEADYGHAYVEVDSDGDGVTDLREGVAGTDHNDASDMPTVEVVGATDNGVLVKWNSYVYGVTYKVYRSTSLTDGFAGDPVQELTVADVTEQDGDSVWEDTGADPNAGPYFYKVITSAYVPGEE